MRTIKGSLVVLLFYSLVVFVFVSTDFVQGNDTGTSSSIVHDRNAIKVTNKKQTVHDDDKSREDGKREKGKDKDGDKGDNDKGKDDNTGGKRGDKDKDKDDRGSDDDDENDDGDDGWTVMIKAMMTKTGR